MLLHSTHRHSLQLEAVAASMAAVTESLLLRHFCHLSIFRWTLHTHQWNLRISRLITSMLRGMHIHSSSNSSSTTSLMKVGTAKELSHRRQQPQHHHTHSHKEEEEEVTCKFIHPSQLLSLTHILLFSDATEHLSSSNSRSNDWLIHLPNEDTHAK